MSKRGIHYYDVNPDTPDKGWVHYVSQVEGWEGVDARVADVVRAEKDVTADTLGWINAPTALPDPATARLLIQEAVFIFLQAPKWLDRLMRNSPFRDSEVWTRQGKQTYLLQRQQRRRKFLAGTFVMESPNVIYDGPFVVRPD